MKKNILTLFIIIITSCIYGQVIRPDTTKREFKNVIGVDITGLIGQFLNLNTSGNYRYSPYVITYKRIFNNNAIRFGVGGSVSSSGTKTNDTLSNKSVRNYLNAGLGIEHYSYLSKKLTLCFGIDAITGYSLDKYINNYTVSSSATQVTSSHNFGVSPLLGLMFRLNSRLSIATETSYDVSYSISEIKRINTPTLTYDYDIHSKSTGIGTQFNAPTSIIIRLQF